MSGGGRLAVAAGVAGVAGLGLVLGLAVAAGAGASAGTAESLAELAPATCVVSGPVPGLTAGQAASADTVVSAALAAGGENMKAAQIAVMTAVTESGLENLAYGTADSLGLFQQRPSQGWGTPAQVMDPVYAAEAFTRALVAVPGWASMPPWLAAQAVQRSAFAGGLNYEANWPAAVQITAAVLGNGNTAGACGQGMGTLASAGGHGLPAGYQIPAGTPPGHAAVADFLHPLLFVPGLRRVVSVTARPSGTGEALRAIRREKTEAAADAAHKARVGQIADLSDAAEYEDLLARERSVIAGHTDVAFAGLVTITAPTTEDLDAGTAALSRAAAQGACELRALYGRQGQGFICGALPLGRRPF